MFLFDNFWLIVSLCGKNMR